MVRLPHVGYGGSPLTMVESRKNGQKDREIIWWDYLVESSEFPHPPARPPVAAPSALAAPRPRQRPPRAAPLSSIRRPLALLSVSG
jgi:hypothetical protein